MKIGIVGYQGSGKSTLFQWLTETTADPAKAHTGQSAMASIPDDRVGQLCKVYEPKKITLASLEILDVPGLTRDHVGSATKLAMIREAGCIIIVVAGFGSSDPSADLQNFEDDLKIADLDIVAGRVKRLEESVKKPRPNRDEQIKELEALKPIYSRLDAGESLLDLELTPEQQRAVKSFQLLSQKPRFVIVNSDDTGEAELKQKLTALVGNGGAVVPLSIQQELYEMPDDERALFCEEMELELFDRDELIRRIMAASRQMIFFTAGEKEVRTWLLPQESTAVEAAGGIHTDMAKGFIRAEVMRCSDLIELGSEREVKAQSLARQEPKDYVVQDGDVLFIKHNS